MILIPNCKRKKLFCYPTLFISRKCKCWEKLFTRKKFKKWLCELYKPAEWKVKINNKELAEDEKSKSNIYHQQPLRTVNLHPINTKIKCLFIEHDSVFSREFQKHLRKEHIGINEQVLMVIIMNKFQRL